MLLRISLELDIDRDEATRNKTLQVLLWSLIALDSLWLCRHPRTPLLYRSGVVYRREPPGFEQWATIPRILAQGGADCEDLAAWRIAELRQKGIKARPAWHFRNILDRTTGEPCRLYHIQVSLPNGQIEDPSRELGMGGDEGPTIDYPAHWKKAP